ncbi:MAG: ATP-dependent sacrificial sulfur transferase LarE, partial [Candidatus Omnitrophica bacterium]|nr:ATP-dependent sacrificial sulfur transferase LarE [Candidatus Omnitrophota bacterium]
MRKSGAVRKFARLKEILAPMDKCLVAFSAGTDSSFLLRAARDALGKNVLAVTAASEFFPASETAAARRLAKKMRVRHLVLDFKPPQAFWDNTGQRCYICKKAMMRKLCSIARRERIAFVLDGSNADDLIDDRPGRKALRELGIRSPLEEAGFTKREIRLLSRSMGLPTWDKEPLSCLATRVASGSKITQGKLKMVGRAESCLRKLGVRAVRVRHHGPLARIETDARGFPLIVKDREMISRCLRRLGFVQVTVDLAGCCRGQ